MTERLETIYTSLPQCKVFSDIGCDHGFITKAMLEGGRCEKAIFSDVSAKCLKKAEKLLNRYIEDGKAEGVVSDGFDGLPIADCALIAGMGGEEIIKILKRAVSLPEKIVLQPMRNCDKVRGALTDSGYRIVEDFTFKASGEYYNLIVAERGSDLLTEDELLFGRTNLIKRPVAFREMLGLEIRKMERILVKTDLDADTRNTLQQKKERFEKYA